MQRRPGRGRRATLAPDYYARLAKMEAEGKAFWSGAATPVPEEPLPF